jgi:dihydropteroate synthase
MIRILNFRNIQEIKGMLESLHVDNIGIGILLHKAHFYLLYLEKVNVPAANILKQEMLSLGGDAALHKGACNFSIPETPCLLMGTYQHFLRLSKKLQIQPFGLKKIGKEIRQTFENFFKTAPAIQAGPYTLDFSKKPLLMGILNVTPDSFSGDGLGKDLNLFLKKAEALVEAGADILDIGGESTRPGHTPVPFEEEQSRVIPAIKAAVKAFSLPISVDSSKPEVVEEALENGAHLINDIWGLQEKKMVDVAKKFGVPVVVMHNQKEAVYEDVVGDLLAFFDDKIQALEKEGIAPGKIILDPGIGFGKTAEHNVKILKNLSQFKIFGKPLLLGVSRKSFIEKVSGASVNERLPGTLASIVLGFQQGFHIFRVHDVKEAKQALQVAQAILEGGFSDG